MKKKEESIRVAQIVGKWLGGGVESVVMNYYRHIDHSKIQFDFICDDDSTNIPYEEIEKLGGKVILIPPYQKVFKYHRELKRILKEGKYEIVHSHINTLSVFPLYAAKKAGVPVRIAHSHSTTNKKEKKKNLIKQLLRPFTPMFATNYMACTEHAGRWMFGDKKFDHSAVYVLNNAIDIERFNYDKNIRDKVRQELNISSDTIVIGHVGRFVEQKNHRFLMDIFNEFHKKNANSKLMLIGQGPLINEIRKKAISLNIESAVLFVGQKMNINEYYNSMDLFLFPSLYEGLGMVVIEAQFNGLPCLVSDEVPEIANISRKIKYLGLEKSAKEWADEIDNFVLRTGRENILDLDKSKKYDIKSESINLEKYYISNYNLNSRTSGESLTLEECKKIQIEILDEIDRYCKKEKLSYSLAYGSMLGAVRHKGFIPWDDDIDIIMPREDYEKFINNYNDSNYKIITSKNFEYYYPFAKIVDNRTYVKMEDNVIVHGIWIDIFPIDNIPNGKYKQKIFLFKNFICRSLILSATTDFKNTDNINKREIKKILYFFSKLLGKNRIIKYYEKLNIKYLNIKTKKCACLSTPYTMHEIYDSSFLFHDLRKYEFENKKYNGVSNYDKYLSMLYGDYMKLPPKEKRRTHRIKAWKYIEVKNEKCNNTRSRKVK